MLSEESVNSVNPEHGFVDPTPIGWFDRKLFMHYPALLVGVYTGPSQEPRAQEYLQELRLLAKTHGIEVIDSLAFSIRTFSAATFLSEGKLAELKEAVEKLGAKLVIFDDDISPAQQRNLENFLRVPVIDRAEVILGVFADRAKTREAKLQIELAQLKYIAPRLKRMWSHFSKQTGGGGGAGGGGYMKGEGEKQIEIDRRLLKQRVERLQSLIREVKHIRTTQRSRRERTGIPIFAIVGYTNAGKSTLMKLLTQADVFIEDKLFATLDTTTRKFILPNTNQELLLIDTVGFIRKLPHHLVMAFRSTLEETVQADILLHVIDATHPMALEQAETTLKVLKELNAVDKRPIITILNKVDGLKEESALKSQQAVYQKLRLTYPRAIDFSALEGYGIEKLFEEIADVLRNRRHLFHLSIPQSEYHIVSEIMRHGHIHHQEYQDNNILLEVEVPIEHMYRYEKYKCEQKNHSSTEVG